ncbi:translation elongation factor Ts [Papillibacter cinnamivorans]|uniref:Elongation factor Ts n=1 Tax=Papillibacter cinnamivorans DSM 12816 TaxID=1122930 RepID=A0A1W1YLL4_9FIRM|nr:translation elongation factor Ts [Papillibacter cinnamivorans]SMC37022.1 elongation factor Ts [Papillibacter cinnamivorans DSM 12816]
MAFTAKDVQTLREMTGVGMMDCKKALAASDGDMEKAVEFLREKGLAAAQKKAGRIAAEGVVEAIVDKNGVGAVVEVNSETDFVAKNESFRQFVSDIAAVVAEKDPADLDALMALPYPGSDKTITEMQQEKVLVIGENIKIRRFARYATGYNVAYVHMGGRIGVIVNMEVSGSLKDNPAVHELGKDICMQIAAMRPLYLDSTAVPADTVESEKHILMEQVMQEGKPAQVAEKIVAGRINKFFEEVCLMNQAFVKENKITVEKHVQQVAKELGGSIAVKAFTRYEKGEGIEKKSCNFAEEVAGMVK